MNFWPIISGLLACGIAGGVITAILKLGLGDKLMRRSELHHTHHKSIPRIGGLAIVIAFLAVEVVALAVHESHTFWSFERTVIVLSSLAMFALGFWDDIKPLGAKRKLLGQVVIAATVCSLGIGMQQFRLPFTEKIVFLGMWGNVLTVLWLVGMTNLINLIDGIDGLAGGISLMLMLLMTYVCQQQGGFEMLTAGMAGALLGFLWFNFPPARVYLGDGGAYFLGFQIGLLSIESSQKGTIMAALVAPLFVLALPIVDTSLAIARRGLRGLPIFRPDRRHLHHHLIGMGFSRRKVVLFFYGVTLVLLAMGTLAYGSRGRLLPLLFGLVVILLLSLAGCFRFSREWFSVGRVLGKSIEMRQNIRYALCLKKWLELEGSRHESIEDLWKDFEFAAHKLGFSSVSLTLPDGSRRWSLPNAAGRLFQASYSLCGGELGLLEIRAQTDVKAPGDPFSINSWNSNNFEIMSELLAECWTASASMWRKGQSTAIRFDACKNTLSSNADLPWWSVLAASGGRGTTKTAISPFSGRQRINTNTKAPGRSELTALNSFVREEAEKG